MQVGLLLVEEAGILTCEQDHSIGAACQASVGWAAMCQASRIRAASFLFVQFIRMNPRVTMHPHSPFGNEIPLRYWLPTMHVVYGSKYR